MMSEFEIQDATKQDAENLAYLINLAGEGIPSYFWSQMTEANETPMQVGIKRATREEGGFSYKNARVIKADENVLGMIISYQLDDPYDTSDIATSPALIRPLIELEAKVPGSWYINAIAIKESARRKGLATRLMVEAEQLALAHDVKQMSIIVASDNVIARQFYYALNYELIDYLPVIDYPGALHGGNWELLVKSL